VNAALFFAFFMLDDPPTSAGPRREQARDGAIVAAVTFGRSLAPGHWRSCLLASWSATSRWRRGGPAAPLGSRAGDIRHDSLS